MLRTSRWFTRVVAGRLIPEVERLPAVDIPAEHPGEDIPAGRPIRRIPMRFIPVVGILTGGIREAEEAIPVVVIPVEPSRRGGILQQGAVSMSIAR
jgi:hypothetical protein